jgi:ribosome-associated heat shock protein Hsp15
MDKVRIDKWLWAARFFKTRALAKNAIENGKVHINGQKPKPSRMLDVGETLTVRQGYDEKILEVVALSDQRRGAPDAQKLYTKNPIRNNAGKSIALFAVKNKYLLAAI